MKIPQLVFQFVCVHACECKRSATPDIPKKRLNQRIHSLCSTLNVPQRKTRSVYHLALQATLHAQHFNWLQRQRILERLKKQLYKRVNGKVPIAVSGHFLVGSTRPLRTFTPGQCGQVPLLGKPQGC